MTLIEYQIWLIEFYKKRNWYQYNTFIRCAFLSEEVGELNQAIRQFEIGRGRPDEIPKSNQQKLEDIKEELGDVIGNILILSQKYNLPIEEIIETHRNKLEKRFEK